MATSDLVLLAYIFLLAPAMIVGFIFARRKMFVPYHKFTMTTIVIVNWILIGLVMAVTYSRDVEPQLTTNFSSPSVWIPTLHLIPGLIAQLLGTYLVIRMWFENQLPSWFKVNNIKLYMRTTLVLWLTTVVLGILTWAVINKGFLATTPNVAVPTASANTVVIKLVSGNKFDPAEVSVPAGTTIQFVNADTRPHTVTADDGSFDSGSMKAGATFSHTFNTAGDIAYYCDFHGGKGHTGMAAVIHVTGTSINAPAETQAATIAPTAAATTAATELAAATQTAGDAGAANVTTVNMSDSIFEPKEITITAGSTVRFVNVGKRKHTVTADDGSFDSGQVEAGGHFDQVFSKVGDVPLYCSNHGDNGGVDMAMVIHVKASDDAGAAPAATQAATQAAAANALPPDQAAAQAALFTKANDTPANVGYVTGAQTAAALIKAQAATITDALKQAHYEDALAAAEAIVNTIEGGKGEDLDADTKVNQPSDGYGLRKYVFGINENANTLEGSATLKTAATAVQTSGRTVLTDLADLTTALKTLLGAKTLVAAREAEAAVTSAAGKLDTDVTALVKASAGLK